VGLAWMLGQCRTARTPRRRSQPGRRPVRGDDAPGPGARPPASGSCGPVRRPGPRQPAGGYAPAPGHAQALGPGPCQSRQRAPLLMGAPPNDRVVSAAADPGQPRAGPGSGSAIAQADRGRGLALAGRPGSAQRAGSDGSWRLTRRRSGRPRRWRLSVVAGGGHRPGAEQPTPRCASWKFVTACDAAPSQPRQGRWWRGRSASRRNRRAPPSFLGGRAHGRVRFQGMRGERQGRRRRWPPSVAYARRSPGRTGNPAENRRVGGSIPSLPTPRRFARPLARTLRGGTQASQAKAISRALQICCIRASLSRPSRSTSVASDTLSTESRLTADVRGIGSSPGSSSTSLGIPRIVVVHGPISVRLSLGMAASRDSTTTGRRPTSGSSHHQTSPRAGNPVTTPRRPPGTRRGLPTRHPRRAGARRTPRTRRRSRPSGCGRPGRRAPHR
jgi:hypothetical protein